jgi:glycolate oxidase FAD binding subunit
LGREGVSTIGGVAAVNAAGPRRVQAGSARDHMLGVRFVDGRGTVVKSGGRVMKNVTGLDLVKLLAGSHGTLGVMSEVSFKVQAQPETEVTLRAEGLGVAAGLAALRKALGSPYEVSGAAQGDFGTLLRIEGLEASVRHRANALRGLLGGAWDEVAGQDLWAKLRDGGGVRGDALWRVSCKPTAAEGVVAALAGTAHQATFDWGGGLIWLTVSSLADGGAALIRGALAGLGHATLLRGPSGVAVFHPEAPGVSALSRAIRAKFDPRGILNAGIMD